MAIFISPLNFAKKIKWLPYSGHANEGSEVGDMIANKDEIPNIKNHPCKKDCYYQIWFKKTEKTEKHKTWDFLKIFLKVIQTHLLKLRSQKQQNYLIIVDDTKKHH